MKDEKVTEIRGPYFMTKDELFAKLAIGRTTFEALTNPSSPDYDEDFPKPVSLFTGRKLRFSSLDVDAYIAKLSHSTKAA